MKLGKGLRSAAAMVLSAATLLAMGALGVGTANADETQVDLTSNDYKNGQITITGGKDRSFELAKLASYNYAATDGAPNLSGVSVQTESTPLAAINTAIESANGGTAPASPYDATNPMVYLADHWTDSGSSPYSGTLRKFVTALAPNVTYSSLGTSTPGTDDLVISDLPVGIYLLKDTTTTAGVSKSLPILVGTTVGTTYTTLASKDIGKVDLKAKTMSFSKTATKLNNTALNGTNRDEQLKKAKIGDTVEFTLGRHYALHH